MRAATLLMTTLLAAPAAAQSERTMTPGQVEGLRGFARGFQAACLESCESSGADASCVPGCFCLTSELSLRVDPSLLEGPGGRGPTPEEITAFVKANRAAFLAAYEQCGVELER